MPDNGIPIGPGTGQWRLVVRPDQSAEASDACGNGLAHGLIALRARTREDISVSKDSDRDPTVPLPSTSARAGFRFRMTRHGLAIIAVVAASAAAQPGLAQQSSGADAALTGAYVRLANNANAVLWEPAEPSPNQRIVAINTHADQNNNFEYFIGRELAARGFRALNVNYYGPETIFEEFLPPIAAAVRHARSLPGVEKVVFATHSGGGAMLAYYQEIAEKGAAACQEPSRILPCDGTDLDDLPPVDGILFLSVNVGAPHRFLSLDPAVESGRPRDRDPSLDLYAEANGYDPETNTAAYSAEFVERYLSGVHARSERLLADAEARMRAIEDGTAPYRDDEPFVVDGMAQGSLGARLNLADPNFLSQTRTPHPQLKADGTTVVEIARSTRQPAGTPPDARDLLEETSRSATVKHYLSFLALRTTPDYAITENDIIGVDWRSSANSAPGNVQNVTVPTLVMAGTCAIHFVTNEIMFHQSAATDKEFVAVEGANHQFNPCRPEFGDTRTRTFDHVEAWLNKPGRF